ncbi:PQQ-dependent sugar dehydrogenase [Rhodohalobacter sp. 8-1]|uniref:PQQ-dependent sugar dehydrogenase n=1 Tax=Rhodohalobacter sp. 8-1 TaxID=3131972 RepID=UPI0030EEDF9C
MKRAIIYSILIVTLFVYGFAVGYYKIFPFQQLSSVKNMVERMGSAEKEPPSVGSVEIMDTFLTKLLVKKVPLRDYEGYGGGLTNSGNILYIISNKGQVQTYDVKRHRKVENTILPLPMKLDEFMQTGISDRNNFRMIWYRVNGVFSEQLSEDEHRLYLSHISYDEDQACMTHNVSRGRLQLSGDRITQAVDWETIFTAEPCIDPEPDHEVSGAMWAGHISGGKIVNYDNENLLVTVGDYNRNGIDGSQAYAMDNSNPYGKTILLNKTTGSWSVFTRGSRNPSGLYRDRNGEFWEVENGPAGGDELNLLKKGQNYGWPRVSYGTWYLPEMKLPGDYETGTHPEYAKPVFSWVPSVAPSGVLRIEHDRFPRWQSDLLVGTMRDRSLQRLRLDESNSVKYTEEIELGHRVRDMAVLENGTILLLTDDEYLIAIDDGGLIYEDIGTVELARMTELERFNNLISESRVEDRPVRSAAAIFEQNCSTCHNMGRSTLIGPHLANLEEREVGGLGEYTYSQALESDQRQWNRRLLRSFLANPDEEFAGSSMPKINLTESEVDSLVQYLLE